MAAEQLSYTHFFTAAVVTSTCRHTWYTWCCCTGSTDDYDSAFWDLGVKTFSSQHVHSPALVSRKIHSLLLRYSPEQAGLIFCFMLSQS